MNKEYLTLEKLSFCLGFIILFFDFFEERIKNIGAKTCRTPFQWCQGRVAAEAGVTQQCGVAICIRPFSPLSFAIFFISLSLSFYLKKKTFSVYYKGKETRHCLPFFSSSEPPSSNPQPSVYSITTHFLIPKLIHNNFSIILNFIQLRTFFFLLYQILFLNLFHLFFFLDLFLTSHCWEIDKKIYDT